MRVPKSGIIGLAASTGAISLWVIEQWSGQMLFEFLTIPFKVTLLAAPLFLMSDLSALLHRRPRFAAIIAIALIVITLCAIAAYLPWRYTFVSHFSNDVYRWYFNGMRERFGGLAADVAEWEQMWDRGVPHMKEAALLITYYIGLIAACTFWRLGRAGGAALALAGYGFLFVAPIFSGLVLWDYDTFLKGIVFDSISLDLTPYAFWFAGDYSLFLYIFLFIFFAVCTTAFLCEPPRDLTRRCS